MKDEGWKEMDFWCSRYHWPLKSAKQVCDWTKQLAKKFTFMFPITFCQSICHQILILNQETNTTPINQLSVLTEYKKKKQQENVSIILLKHKLK